MKNLSTVYNNGEIIVTFNSCACKHAGKCTENISEVIQSSLIQRNKGKESKTKRMIQHISKCPSGALQYNYIN